MKAGSIDWKKTGLVTSVTGLLFSLSVVSGFHVVGPYEVNFDVATMLTPYGILQNLVFDETYLTKYYMEVTPREDLSSRPWLAVLLLVHLITVASTWWCFSKAGRR